MTQRGRLQQSLTSHQCLSFFCLPNLLTKNNLRNAQVSLLVTSERREERVARLIDHPKQTRLTRLHTNAAMSRSQVQALIRLRDGANRVCWDFVPGRHAARSCLEKTVKCEESRTFDRLTEDVRLRL